MEQQVIELKAQIFDLMVQRDQAIVQVKRFEEETNKSINEKLELIKKLQEESKVPEGE